MENNKKLQQCMDVFDGGARASSNCRALNLVGSKIQLKMTTNMEKIKKNRERNPFLLITSGRWWLDFSNDRFNHVFLRKKTKISFKTRRYFVGPKMPSGPYWHVPPPKVTSSNTLLLTNQRTEWHGDIELCARDLWRSTLFGILIWWAIKNALMSR